MVNGEFFLLFTIHHSSFTTKNVFLISREIWLSFFKKRGDTFFKVV